jgi:hypothetical protein
MPVAGFRGWVGFAKPNGFSYLTAAVSAAGTTLTIATSGFGITAPAAASTIYIIDGANSEVVTNSAGGGTGSQTVSAFANNHAANVPIVSQLTASKGPAGWIPATNISPSDMIAFIDDKGIRGSNVSAYNSVQATQHAELEIDGDVFTDEFGYVLGSIYGAVDFSSGTPNSHTFAGMNTAASNGQPTPLLVFIYNGNNVRLYAGAKCSEVAMKFDVGGNLSYTSKWTSFGSLVATGIATTSTFTTVTPQGAWQAAGSINSVTVPNILSADFTIKRDSIEAIQTLDGSQQATVVWSGPLSTAGNLNLTYEDDTNIALFLAGAPIPVTFTLSNGSGATQSYIQLQMTKAIFVDGWKVSLPGSKGYVEVGGPVTAVSNTTDANTAGGGYSPSRVLLKNTLATGTFQ